MSLRRNLVIDQGATFNLDVDLQNDDGTPFAVAGWVGAGQIRKHYESNTAITFGVALTDGVAALLLTSSQTDLMDPGLYVYDVELKHIDTNVVRRIIGGGVTVYPQVTRSTDEPTLPTDPDPLVVDGGEI